MGQKGNNGRPNDQRLTHTGVAHMGWALHINSRIICKTLGAFGCEGVSMQGGRTVCKIKTTTKQKKRREKETVILLVKKKIIKQWSHNG